MASKDVRIREHVPLYPMHAVLFPGMLLPAHVRQPGLIEMMDRVLNTREELGVVLINRRQSTKTDVRPHTMGTLARIVRMERHPDGTMSVVFQGTQRFRIRAMEQRHPYLQASVESLVEEETPSVRMEALAAKVRELWHHYRETLQNVAGVTLGDGDLPHEAVHLAYTVAANIQSGLSDKQRLVSQPSVEDILAAEIPLLLKELRLLEFIDETQEREQELRLGPTGYLSRN